MNPLYVFFHLAKTGGTTFVGHLYERLKFDEEFVDLGPHGDVFRKEHNHLPLEQRSQQELDKIKAIVGHLVYWDTLDLFPNREKRLITFFRKPITRIISHYTFDTSVKDEPFSMWYRRWIKNQTIFFLIDHLRVNSIDEVLTRLEQFWHIGFTEDLDNSLHYIYKELGIDDIYKNRRVAGESENTTKDLGYDPDRKIKAPYKPTEEEIQMMESDNQMAIWFYDHMRKNTINGKYTKPKDLVIPNFPNFQTNMAVLCATFAPLINEIWQHIT